MKTLKYTLLICALFISTLMNAQTITRVSGTVSDDIDVIPGVQVTEIDNTNRVVSAATTDMNGNFTMSIKSQKNKLKFKMIGYKEQILPINKTVYKVRMSDNVTAMKEVTVQGKKMAKGSGLEIPEREISYAAQGISAADFEGLGITSVDEALQGRIAGLDIVANSGNLGAGSQMRLRGTSTVSTLTSNEPLIVVNNQIATDLDMSDFDVATATDEKFAELLKVNTEDIQEIKVLKDASATAIWGTRGANGVIEITTKRGQRGPAHVSYVGKLTATYQPEAIKLLTGDQYTMMLKEAYFNPKLSDSDGDIRELNYDYAGFSEAYMFDNNTDWLNLVKQTGLRQNHSISVTGGDEKVQFRISGGYDHETGTVIKQKMDRLTTRMALDYTVSDRIRIMSNFAMTYTDNARNYDQLMPIAYKKMPNLSPYYEYENGVPSSDYYYMLQTTDVKLNDQKNLQNPVALAELAKYSQRTYNLTPELELEYKLLGLDNESHQLRYNGNVYVNVSNQYDDKDMPRDLSTGTWIDTHSAYSYSAKSLSFTTRHSLTFIPHFKNQDNFMTVMGRFEMNTGSNSSQSINANRLPNGVSSPSAGGLISSVGSGYGQWKGLVYLLTGHYSWKSRYSIMGNFRLDGTTKLGPNRRWNNSYSISGRWNIIDEPFMEVLRDKAKMSMLSVRPGWGVVHNLPGQDYLYMNKYSPSKSYLGYVSMNPSGFKLTNMNSETINSFNLGFDLGFWQDKIKLTLDVYDRRTYDMLMSSGGISSATGQTSLGVFNNGSMKNQGWEFNINGMNLARKGKFWLDFYVNFANNRNVIMSMAENILEGKNTQIDDLPLNNAATLRRVQINNPFGSIYGFRSKGVYQYNYETARRLAKTDAGRAQLQENVNNGITYPISQNADGDIVFNEKGEPIQMVYTYKDGKITKKFDGGDAMYEDINHDGQINQLDIVYLGSSLPKLTGGFGFTLHYSQWRLSTQFNYRVDYDIFNLSRLNMESMSNNNNQSQAVNYRWRKEGDVTSIPRALNSYYATNYNTLISDRFIEDGTFLRMNYLQLSYNFDNKLIKKAHLNRVNLYVSANNLFCLTKYTGVDPEVAYGQESISTDGSNTPRSKSWTFGATIEF